MRNEVHVYHHQVNSQAKKKKPEPFWKGMGKLIVDEAVDVVGMVIDEAVDVGDHALHALALSEPPKKKTKRR